jgi:segregation and condensation protein A
MSRILERLKIFSSGLSMRLLLKEEPGRTSLVVTLLALLELSRRNRVALLQKELFGDVFITARDE